MYVIRMYASMYVWMYLNKPVYVCMYIYVYMYIYDYRHKHIESKKEKEKEYKKKRTDMPKSKTARGSSGVLLLYVEKPKCTPRLVTHIDIACVHANPCSSHGHHFLDFMRNAVVRPSSSSSTSTARFRFGASTSLLLLLFLTFDSFCKALCRLFSCVLTTQCGLATEPRPCRSGRGIRAGGSGTASLRFLFAGSLARSHPATIELSSCVGRMSMRRSCPVAARSESNPDR